MYEIFYLEIWKYVYFFLFMTKLALHILYPTVYIEMYSLYRNNDLINLIIYISKQFIKYFI